MTKNLKILHQANDYSGSTVYKNLCTALDCIEEEHLFLKKLFKR